MKKLQKKKNTRAQNKKSNLPITGIGASAGGLDALRKFFNKVPENSGIAFVVVVHLDPDHKSMLAELLQPHIKMPVEQVLNTTELKPNHVYVIPPNANLNTIDTHLRLTELEEKRSQRAPIDHFFRTLANTHDGNAAGIILTGSGSDGTLGIKEIKEKGGLTIAQNPQEADYDGMPQSAISTGLIDMILPLDKMASTLVTYFSTKPKLPVIEDEKKVEKELQQNLHKLFAQVKARTGRDFSRYKTSTIIRRIQRRMQINQTEEFPDYLDLLRKNQEEVRTLSDDFLINVTNFFRDTEVFDYLEHTLLPAIVENKNETEQLRIWSVGCATGEEAYSLAMLVQETLEKMELSLPVQIFASDLHQGSLKKAREGFFPGDIKTDVNPERLKRFFIQEKGNYRIRKDIREQVIFTPHNLLGDPPFSHLDLVVCRNLLIYLKRDVQKDVFELFHYSLVPNGYLVLGPSESLENSELFSIENKEFSTFKKKNINGPEPRLPVFPSVIKSTHEPVRQQNTEENIPFSSMHKKAVEHYGPPSLLISPDYQVLHISESAGRYLMHQGGEPSRDIFRLIRKELQLELRTAIHSARDNGAIIRSKPVQVKIDGKKRQLVVSVREIEEPSAEKSFLIFFEEYDRQLKKGIRKTAGDESEPYISQISKLEDELKETRQQLQAIIEEYETSREEMKASNEELQSSNEELRSTLEELETSKEELQSLNEELTTMNQENRHKVEELSMMSDDLQNLLKATNIATLFLDRELRIQRFTPQLGELFNVRTTDRGRQISDITHKLGYHNLEKDAKKVLKNLQPVILETDDTENRTYLTRLLPYRSSEDAIQGVVITFIDITQQKKNEERLRKMLNIEQVGVLSFSKDARLIDANDSFLQMLGFSRKDFNTSKPVWKGFVPPEFIEINVKQLKKLAETGKIGPYEKKYINKDGSHIWMMFVGAALNDGTIIEYCIDITDKKKAEKELAENEERLRLTLNSMELGSWMREYDSENLFMDEKNAYLFGFNGGAQNVKPEQIYERMHQEDRALIQQAVKKAWDENSEYNEEFRIVVDGKERWIASRGKVVQDGSRKMIGINFDITERKKAQKELQDAKEAAEKAAKIKEEFLAHMSHEIRTPLNSIVGITHVLKAQPHSKKQEKNLKILSTAGENLNRLINDILDFSKIQAGKVKINISAVEIKSLMKHIAQIHKPLAKEKNINLKLLIDNNVPKYIDSDKGKLTQILHNLLSNAVKFTSTGEVKLEVKLKQAKNGSGRVHFAVTDTGIGIAKDKQGEIFEVFTQVDNSKQREYSGTGLGLSIVRSYLKLLGSDIHIKSKKGEGAQFWFELPAVCTTENNTNKETPPGTNYKKDLFASATILVVEDDSFSRMMLVQLLSMWEIKFDEAVNGKVAVEMAEKKEYNLILMDLHMPIMDGIEATQKIRNLKGYKNKPVYALMQI